MDKIEKRVKQFKEENGNANYSTKDLVIYFNTERKEDIEEIKDRLNKLPCGSSLDRLQILETKIETAKRIAKFLVATALAVVGTVIGVMSIT